MICMPGRRRWTVRATLPVVGGAGLNGRSDRVLAGETLPRSRVHHSYVATELVQVFALLAPGTDVLTT
ncbi:hypothetical protein [Streptomyces lydicus]|uniref:hypothetical protein n=1 Tax=Streptomyces lydicus TaxID=47763 RepID=UPI0037151CA6